MRDITNRKEALLAIAEQEKISLYQRFTESEASAILDVSVQTLRRIRERGEIAYIRVSERNIRYFGLHLCQYVLSKVEDVICHDIPKIDTKSVTTGSPSNQEVQHGVGRGTTLKPSKQDELASARRILKKPKQN